MANIKFSDFTANGNIDGGAVPSPSGSETSFLVGFDSTAPTNNKWTLDQIAAGLPTLYAGDGSINEDRVITVGLGTNNNTYTTSFESTKNNGTSTRNSSGNILQIKETYTGQIPVNYSQTRGAVLKLHATQNNSSTNNTESYIHSFIVNSGGSDYVNQDQMGFRTNRAFVFKATDTSWPIYFAVAGGPSNNPRQMVYAPGNGGLLQLKAGNARTTKITLADTSSHGTNNGYYRYIDGGNNGNLILGRKLSGGSEEAYITCSGVGGYTGNVAVGINQSTPAETLHVTGNVKIDGQAYTEIESSVAIDSVNWNNSNVQEVTLVSGATTDFDATNFKAGATYILKLIQPAGGNALVGWEAAGAVVNWSGGTPPTLSTAAAAEDIVTLICTSAAGNGTYYANATLNFS